MAWTEPLSLETWIINVFSGNIGIFTAISLFVIAGTAAYFRMSILLLVFVIGIFMLMFSGYVDQSIYFILISLGGLLVGYWISQIIKR